MKILVCDQLHPAGMELLEKEAEVEVVIGLNEKALMEKLRDKDAVVVRSGTKVTANVIENARNLKVIGRAGVGVDNIDVAKATERGIVVVNAPEASTITVAEHTMGMILSLARMIPFADTSLRDQKWEKRKFLGTELRGKTLGIIGLGKIGSQVAKKAKAFEMRVIAYDPYIPKNLGRKFGVKIVGLKELLQNSDFITIHAPLTDKTRRMIGKKEIEMMKKDTCIINCARGGIVDEKALYEALKSHRIKGAALDVFEEEPPIGNPLLTLENVVVTPHLGASTEEAQRYASVIACEEVLKVLKNQLPRYAVNVPTIAPEALEELQSYLFLAERMGKFCTQLLKGRFIDVSITYCGKLINKEFEMLTNAVMKGLLDPILTGVNLLNARMLAKNRGIRITEGKREDAGDFKDMIILNVKTEKEETEIKGILLGDEPRIVDIEGYAVDLVPKGDFLVVKHDDRPGMIGKIALSLGENNINIGSMQVGRKEVGGIQLMVLTVDHKINKKILNVISGLDGIKKVNRVKVP